MQVKPTRPLQPQRPPQQLEQLFRTAQRARQLKPKSILEQHLETIAAAQQIYQRTQQLRAQTRKLCARTR